LSLQHYANYTKSIMEPWNGELPFISTNMKPDSDIYAQTEI
jgi:hypothetical protein